MRVLIVDDHTLVRAGLSRLLQGFAGVDVVAEAMNADQAIDLAAIHRPDVVLLDLSLPGRTGLEALSGILEKVPATRVVMMSMHDDPMHVRDALDRGAAGRVILNYRENKTTGYLLTDGELQPGAYGLAAPVIDVPGVEASVGVVSFGQLDPHRAGPRVVRAAAEVAGALR